MSSSTKSRASGKTINQQKCNLGNKYQSSCCYYCPHAHINIDLKLKIITCTGIWFGAREKQHTKETAFSFVPAVPAVLFSECRHAWQPSENGAGWVVKQILAGAGTSASRLEVFKPLSIWLLFSDAAMFPRLNCGFECNFSFYWQKWAVLIRLCFLVGLNWSFCSVFLQEATTNASEDIEEASASQQTDVPTQEVSEAESPEGEEATAGEVQYCFIFIY